MYKAIREIRLFFAQHGKLLFQILGVCLIIVFIIQGLNEKAKDEYNAKIQQEQQTEKIRKEKTNQEKFVSDFIKYCNEQNTYFAYKMISDSLKTTEYKEINEFKNKFIIAYFNEEKKFSISKYDNNIYNVELYNDILESGNKLDKKVIKIKLQHENNNIKIIELGENI